MAPSKSILDYWWVALVRGAAAIVFGVLALLWPKLTVIVLVAFIAAYWIVDGVASIYYAVNKANWGWPFWAGIVSVAAGGLAIYRPGVATFSILLVIAIWSIVRGILDIYTAIRLREEIDFEWWLGAGGVLAVIFGMLVLVNPAAGALAIAKLIGAFSIAIGLMLVLAGFHMRRMGTTPRVRMAPPSAMK